MTNEKRKNAGASVKDRLLNLSRAMGIDFQILLTRYALERLLYRLSVSEHRDRFVLKGAMLLATWVSDPFRPTRDLDLLGYGDAAAEAVARSFRTICAQEVDDDGVTFDIAALEAAPIRENADYAGVRVRTTATIAGARISIQVDIGFGDVVTPGPIDIDYPVLLDAPAPHLRVYPVETVIAEKFEALTTLGIANSRLKDFYDLWLLAQTFEFRARPLVEAVRRTFERRNTALPSDLPVGLGDEFAAVWAAQWQTFLGRERMAAAPETFAQVIAGLRDFLMPLATKLDPDSVWSPGGPWLAGS
jgi:predicted nucleotidyltransferase component of viral defense system